MPLFTLYLVGQPTEQNKVFGWTSEDLNNEVFYVAGPYKMVSIFIRTLLTEKGSVIGRPNEGTEFLELFEGNYSDARELQERMIEILTDAFEQVQEFQQSAPKNGEIEDNELLVDFNISEFYVSEDGGSASIKVELSNAAGETVPGLIPVRKPGGP